MAERRGKLDRSLPRISERLGVLRWRAIGQLLNIGASFNYYYWHRTAARTSGTAISRHPITADGNVGQLFLRRENKVIVMLFTVCENLRGQNPFHLWIYARLAKLTSLRGAVRPKYARKQRRHEEYPQTRRLHSV